ncbi:MAG: LLM class flavin-dependent oxidoreductase [Ectothiorhodospiraceae bacterium]|nr:LLM class flavin-dependent oxidoreductase [Chromatiales bacterium]MCP5153705.1 LLM class flavin-dependent oxidoreductase [Ectothiorhodospiraceae bacterium]
MKVGLFTAAQWHPGADLAQGFRDLLEQGRVARASGFASFLVGQHMLTGPEMQMFQTVPLMARLLPEIEGMQIGPGVLLLPMVNPVMAAEEGATIDWMSDGNYVLAGGLGYRDEEFEAMGTRRADRVPRLVEAVEVIRRLWTEDRVTHHGTHYRVTGVGASVLPKQRPHPPIWLGGDVEPAVRRAARIADAWLAAPAASLDRLQALLAVYRAERAKHGLPTDTRCPIIRECFVGTNAEHARRVSRGPLLAKYQAYAAWGQSDTAGTNLADDFDAFSADRFLVGDAAKVRDDLQRLVEVTGTDHVLVRTQWLGTDQAEAVAAIERIGNLVAKL